VEKGEDTSDDPESNDTFLTYAIEGRTRRNVWYEGVVSQITQKQSAQEIDVVSGATYSSRAIAEAAQQALDSIQEEETE
jgi:major membrane immunogen (membrane-anchored lipoprotein)